jgi:hypothetical protein
MYADKVGQFFDSILHASNVGKPLMGGISKLLGPF